MGNQVGLEKMGNSIENFDNDVIDGKYRDYEQGCHRHTLRVQVVREPYKCNGCKMPGSRICYKCVDELCNVYLHLDCFPRFTGRKPHLLDDCDFDFHRSPPQVAEGGDVPYCDACGLDILGFRYRCSTKSHQHNPHDLHPTCANLGKEMTWGRYKYTLLDNVETRCLHCDERYPAEGCIRFTGWKWVAKNQKHWGYPFCFSGRKICFHVKCMNEIHAPGYRRKKH